MRVRIALAFGVIGALATAACSSKRQEAIRFGKYLSVYQKMSTELGKQEGETVLEMSSWSKNIAFMGPTDTRPDDKARDLFMRVRYLYQNIHSLRQGLEQQRLEAPSNQAVRATIVEKLKQRESFLRDLRDLLEKLPKEFESTTFGKVPPSITEINNRLRTYAQPEELYTPALKEIRLTHQLTDDEIKIEDADKARTVAKDIASTKLKIRAAGFKRPSETDYFFVECTDPETDAIVYFSFTKTHPDYNKAVRIKEANGFVEGQDFKVEYTDTAQDPQNAKDMFFYMNYLKLP